MSSTCLLHYSQEELQVLLETYQRHREILDGNSMKELAIQRRADIWDQVKTVVNNVHGNVRTTDQYRKRLRRLVASFREKEDSESDQFNDDARNNPPSPPAADKTFTNDSSFNATNGDSSMIEDSEDPLDPLRSLTKGN